MLHFNGQRNSQKLGNLAPYALVVVALLAFSCNSSDTALAQNALVSECGGFAADAVSAQQALMVGDVVADAQVDCSESLQWTYDEATATVFFWHKNNQLNCCGERTLVVSQAADSDSFELAETDKSQGGARCGCVCMFDFRVEVPNVDGTLHVKLTLWEEQEEVPNPPRATVWEGDIDLTAGSGVELIKERNGGDGSCW